MGTIVQPPALNTAFDPMSASTSFTARRSAASSLPNFELPPPPLSKYSNLTSFVSQPVPTNHTNNVGNLLTPPSNIPGEVLSPMSSGNTSVHNTTAASQGPPPQTPNSLWTSGTGTGLTPFASFGTGTTPQPQPWGQGTSENLLPPRGLFSPSLNTLLRNNSGSPSTSEGVPPPPYSSYQLPPFSTSMSYSSGSLPALTPQQQQQAMVYMSSQPQTSTSVQSPPALNTADSYLLQRAPPTPSYYNGSQPSSTPQQSQFPALSNPSPVQQSLSPLSAGPPSSRLSPPHTQSGMMQPVSQPMPNYQRPFSSFPLPAMSGPVMTNTTSPGSQMSMVGIPQGMVPGGFNSGHVALGAHMQQMYHNQQSVPHNDRPFKCDQCPQSFNRNHDLKRHKRIHLAVKPFPCGYCDKSFSRKDALKVLSILKFPISRILI